MVLNQMKGQEEIRASINGSLKSFSEQMSTTKEMKARNIWQ